MTLRATFCLPRCLLAALTVLGGSALPGAEPIRFSKPTVEIAAPDRAEPKLPETRVKGFDFSAPPVAAPMSQPMMTQPSILLLDPRDRNGGNEDESDDRSGRRDLYDLRDLRKLPGSPREQGGPGQKDSKGAAGANSLYPFNPNRMNIPGLSDPMRAGRPEDPRSLSPVTSFDWEERDSLAEPGGSSSRNRKGQRSSNPFAAPDDEEESSPRHSSPFELFSSRPKEKPGRELLERRAAFEELLNPNAEIAVKSPNSLDPVSALDPARPPVTGVMPTLGMPKIAAGNRDPMQAYNQQQTSLRGPRMEDVNSRYAPPTGSSAAPNTESRFQRPLSRQPTFHDMPKRKF